jgi:hypothetical protein
MTGSTRSSRSTVASRHRAAVAAAYSTEVRSCSDEQLAALVLKRTELAPQFADLVAELAGVEAQRRGHELPTLWALSRQL